MTHAARSKAWYDAANRRWFALRGPSEAIDTTRGDSCAAIAARYARRVSEPTTRR